MSLWIGDLAIFSLIVGLVSAVVIGLDLLRHPQSMWIMNVVWPLTGLYSGLLGLWAYFRYGRMDAVGHAGSDKEKAAPFAVSVGKGAAHCGAGCTLGDIVAEWLTYFVPTIAVWFGWGTLFSEKMFAVWIVDFVFAFLFGIVFQYFAIAPMRGLSFGEGMVAALKADSLSLIAWQVGMYGFMAVAQFYLYRHLLGRNLEPDTVEFWFMMQIAMLAGFITSYPVNWWLIKSGIKERM
jgi:hypothetical protein